MTRDYSIFQSRFGWHVPCGDAEFVALAFANAKTAQVAAAIWFECDQNHREFWRVFDGLAAHLNDDEIDFNVVDTDCPQDWFI